VSESVLATTERESTIEMAGVRNLTAGEILARLTGAATLAAGSLLVGQGTATLASTGTGLTYAGGVLTASGANPTIVLGNGNGSAAAIRINPWTATNRNWTIDSGVTGTQLNFTPSTAAGGNTYTTPVLTLFGATGVATFAAGITCATLTANGATITSGAGTITETICTSATSFAALRIRNTGASGRSFDIGNAGSSVGGPYGTGLYIYDNTAAAIRGWIAADGSWIFGATDSGGSELVRVVGGIRASGLCNFQEIVAGSTYAYLNLVRSTAGNSSAVFMRDSSNTKYNWIAAVQYNTDNAFEITASSAVGGSTYSQVLLTCQYDGTKKLSFFGATPVAKPSMAAATGSATRTTYDTTTVTLPQLAERVKALIDDLRAFGLEG